MRGFVIVTVFTISCLWLLGVNGELPFILVQKQAKAKYVHDECHLSGHDQGEYRPATNADVLAVVDFLHDEWVTANIWIASTFTDTSSTSLLYAFSWEAEPVDEALWFRTLLTNARKEPDKLTERCTVLRRRFSFFNSNTGKHMLGNKLCDDETAMYLCTRPIPTTTPDVVTTTLITTPTTTSTMTSPPTSPPSTSIEDPTTTTTTTACLTTSTPVATTTVTNTNSNHSNRRPSGLNSKEMITVEVCPCACPEGIYLLSILNVSVSAGTFLEMQRNNLLLNPQDLSITNRQKTSANDNRSSSRICGYIAISFLMSMFGMLICFDLTTVRCAHTHSTSTRTYPANERTTATVTEPHS